MENEHSHFKVVTIGTGCARPSLSRGGSSVLLKAGGQNIVVDMGLGSLHSLLRAGVTHNEVGWLLFTHFHTDHTADAGAFLFAANYDETPRAAPLTIIAGEGLEHFMAGMENLHGRWVAPKNYPRAVVTAHPGDALNLGTVTARPGPASHDESSLSWRFEYAGVSVVVTGDTGPNENLAKFARGADLLLCEASLPHDQGAPYHLSAIDAGQLAKKAGVKHLVLTHFYPASEGDDPARWAATVFDGQVTAATDGAEFILLPRLR